MTARYWCERAWLGGRDVEAGVMLEVEGDRIAAVTTGVQARPEDAVPLWGMTLPALANGHSHAFHRALRGRTHGGRGTFWTWRDLMYRVAARLDPDRYYRLARATFAEMTLAGVGAVGEFHYVHHRLGGDPYEDPNAMGLAVAAAARDAGIRLTLLDTLYLHGGLDAAADRGYEPLRPEQARFGDGSAERWAERAEALAAATSGPAVRPGAAPEQPGRMAAAASGPAVRAGAAPEQPGTTTTTTSSPTVRVGAAVHSVRAVDPAAIKVAVEWAGERGAPLHFHASEQPAENEQCLAVHGRTPVEVIAEAGGLGPDTTLVHATHTTGRDRALIGEAGARCCLCPTTERDLADGVGPAVALVRAGIPLCVGSDSHAVVDLFEEVRAVELDQRAATRERGVFAAEELVTMATAAGYRSLGWPEGGVLEPGALADFATVGLDSVRLAGTGNALAAVVFAATAADVRHLVVGGRTVVRDGAHTTVDVAAELASAVPEVTTP